MKFAIAVLLGLVKIEESSAELVQCPYGHYHEHADNEYAGEENEDGEIHHHGHHHNKQFGIPTNET